jgi:hypothetical protein
MRAALAPALLAALVLLAPAAQACHPALGLLVANGPILLGTEPYGGSIRFGTCAGTVQVEVVRTHLLHPTLVPDEDRFEAELVIHAPAVPCLFASPCGPPGPPVPVAFTLRNAALGVELDGVAQNGAHLTYSAQLAGPYLGGWAAFALAAA